MNSRPGKRPLGCGVEVGDCWLLEEDVPGVAAAAIGLWPDAWPTFNDKLEGVPDVGE